MIQEPPWGNKNNYLPMSFRKEYRKTRLYASRRLRRAVNRLGIAIWKTPLLVFVERNLLIPAVAFLSRLLARFGRTK